MGRRPARRRARAATAELPELLGLALRRNPKRAHLLVSNVLGKHVPQRPARGLRRRPTARAAGARACWATRRPPGRSSSATPRPPPASATRVADGLGARALPALHPPAGAGRGARRAASRRSTATPPPTCCCPRTRTARRGRPAGAGRRRVLHRQHRPEHDPRTCTRAIPRDRYVVVALVDMRSAADRGRLDRVRRGARRPRRPGRAGRRHASACPTGVLDRGASALVAEHERTERARGLRRARPAGGARAPGDAPPWRASTSAGPPGCPTAAARLHPGTTATPRWRPRCPRHGRRRRRRRQPRPARTPARVLVLGFEELMYAPLRLGRGAGTERASTTPRSRYSTTTRSPVLPWTTPATPSAAGSSSPPTTRPGPTGDAGERYAYNVAAGPRAASTPSSPSSTPPPTPPNCTPPAGCWPGSPRTPTACCCWPSSPSVRARPAPGYPPPAPVPQHAPRPAGRRPARAAARPRLLLLRRPTRSAGCSRTSPTSTLEAPTEEREEAIQSGGAHYAESLPVEYQPSAAVPGSCSRRALDASAARIARAVGAVTETVLAERSPAPRAGVAGPRRHPRRAC